MNDTGGPAFPVPPEQSYAVDDTGMTLLDYFAGRAMQTVLQCHFKHNDEPNFGNVARWAYVQAEAMIAEKRRHEDDKS